MDQKKEKIYRWSIAFVWLGLSTVGLFLIVGYFLAQLDVDSEGYVLTRLLILPSYLTFFLFVLILYFLFPVVAFLLSERGKRSSYALKILPLWLFVGAPPLFLLESNLLNIPNPPDIEDYFPFLLIGSTLLLTYLLWSAIKRSAENKLLKKWLLLLLIYFFILNIPFAVNMLFYQPGPHPYGDAARLSELQTMQGYLDSYYEKFSRYPEISVSTIWDSSHNICGQNTLCRILKDSIGVKSIPNDRWQNRDFLYCVSDEMHSEKAGQSFILGAYMSTINHPVLEEELDMESIPPGYTCTDPTFDCRDKTDDELKNGLCIEF